MNELNRLEGEFVMFKENAQAEIASLKNKVETLMEKADTISGKEAAEMLGWNGYMKATWLTEHGITFTQDDNGKLHISRKDMEKYVSELNKD